MRNYNYDTILGEGGPGGAVGLSKTQKLGLRLPKRVQKTGTFISSLVQLSKYLNELSEAQF